MATPQPEPSVFSCQWNVKEKPLHSTEGCYRSSPQAKEPAKLYGNEHERISQQNQQIDQRKYEGKFHITPPIKKRETTDNSSLAIASSAQVTGSIPGEPRRSVLTITRPARSTTRRRRYSLIAPSLYIPEIRKSTLTGNI